MRDKLEIEWTESNIWAFSVAVGRVLDERHSGFWNPKTQQKAQELPVSSSMLISILQHLALIHATGVFNSGPLTHRQGTSILKALKYYVDTLADAGESFESLADTMISHGEKLRKALYPSHPLSDMSQPQKSTERNARLMRPQSGAIAGWR